jgi:hypothetical protein
VWLWLSFKVFFIWKCIKIIFFIFKKLVLTSAPQNDLKTPKIYINLKQRKNKKNLNFFKSIFKTQKQTDKLKY